MAVHLPDVGPQPLGPATARSGRHQGRYGLLVAPTDIRTVWRSHPVRIFRTSLQRFGPMSLTGTHTALALRNSRRRRRAGVEFRDGLSHLPRSCQADRNTRSRRIHNPTTQSPLQPPEHPARSHAPSPTPSSATFQPLLTAMQPHHLCCTRVALEAGRSSGPGSMMAT
jgi:hypothetical protein